MLPYKRPLSLLQIFRIFHSLPRLRVKPPGLMVDARLGILLIIHQP